MGQINTDFFLDKKNAWYVNILVKGTKEVLIKELEQEWNTMLTIASEKFVSNESILICKFLQRTIHHVHIKARILSYKKNRLSLLDNAKICALKSIEFNNHTFYVQPGLS